MRSQTSGIRGLLLLSCGVVAGLVGVAPWLSPPVAAAPVLTYAGSQTTGFVGRPFWVVVSPDGAHAYVLSSGGVQGLSAFARDAVSGALTPIETEDAGLPGYLNSHAISGDGKHVYAVGTTGISVYSRNASTGELIFVESELNGVGGVTGVANATGVVVSPDGANVYVYASSQGVGQPDGALAAFSRDSMTGELTFVNALFDNVGGVDGLATVNAGAGTRPLAISPDGLFLYTGGLEDNAVGIFARDTGSGAVSFVSAVYGGVGPVRLSLPNGIAITPDGKYLYAVSYGHQVMTAFRRNLVTGLLTYLEVEAASEAVGSPSGELVMTPDGARLFSARWATGLPSYFIDPANGAVTYTESPTTGLDGDTGIGISADGRHIYVATYGGYVVPGGPPAVVIYAVTCGNGVLDGSETCDDGNGVGGDGCSPICEVEPCWICAGAGAGSCTPKAPGAACPADGNVCSADECDGAGLCVHPDVSEGTPCDDLVPCTATSACLAGACRGLASTCGDGVLQLGCEQCDAGPSGGVGCQVDCALAPRHAEAVAEAGDTVTTDVEADGATAAAPVEVSVTSPTAGLVSIDITAAPPDPVADFVFFGSKIDITAPVSVAVGPGDVSSGDSPGSAPLRVSLRADAALVPPGLVLAELAIVKDGVVIGGCSPAHDPGEALPDPCVDSRQILPDGDIEVVILTTTASAWSFSLPEPVCPTAPAVCRQAALSTVLLKDNATSDSRDKLVWKWLQGAQVDFADIADPVIDAGYSVCLYTGPSEALVGGASLSAGARWSRSGSGYLYKGAGEEGGVSRVILRPGATGKAKAIVKGVGANLTDLDLANFPLPLRLQLRNGATGVCMESVFDAADVQRRDAALFRARSQP